MAADIARDEVLARLQARVAQLERRRRFPRRFLPLAIVTLLVALLPLSILAAGPVFSDLDTAAAVHRPNIQAIGDVGITTGFEDPNDPAKRTYNPKGQVTREEMASFLARTAGLGGNPPVANAKTAQDAAALGGQPPSAYLTAAGDTTLRYSPLSAVGLSNNPTLTPSLDGSMVITLETAKTSEVVLPLPRPTGEYGHALAVKGLRVCYTAAAGIYVGTARLYANECKLSLSSRQNSRVKYGSVFATASQDAGAGGGVVAAITSFPRMRYDEPRR